MGTGPCPEVSIGAVDCADSDTDTGSGPWPGADAGASVDLGTAVGSRSHVLGIGGVSLGEGWDDPVLADQEDLRGHDHNDREREQKGVVAVHLTGSWSG
jgi:hypothetical protein